MTKRRTPLFCLGLGALASCGFAPFQLWPLTIVCLALWMALVHDAPTMRAASWRGWLFGLGHFTINDNWFQHAFDFQDKMPPVLGYAAPVLLALYLAVYPMAAAGLAWRFASPRSIGDRWSRAGLAFALVFGAAWIATEYLRATMFTGYAWDPLGVIWVPVQPVAWLTTLVGTYALSGLTIVLAGALIVARSLLAGMASAAVLAALLIAQSLSYRVAAAAPLPPTPHLIVVQPDIGNDQRGNDASERALAALLRQSGRSRLYQRLILWPEGLLTDLFEDGYPPYVYDARYPEWLRARVAAALGPRDIVMTSADTLTFDSGDNVSGAGNSVLAIDARARIVGRYDKAHLVPYGEYLPMPWLLRPLGLARLVPGDLDFTPGPGPATLQLPGIGPVGVQVCYEIIFSGEVIDPHARPRLLFNPSNDAWFGRWGPPQHLAQARMRAIEEGLPIVRATPTGISAVIGADGRLVAALPLGTAGTIDVPFPPVAAPTLFSRLHNLMAVAVAVAFLIGAIAVRRRAR